MKFPTSTVCTGCDSPLGPILLAACGDALVGIWFEGQQHRPESQRWATAPEHPVLQRTAMQLAEYFSGQRRQFDLALDLSAGTAFQQAVWSALLDIPSGATISYGALSAAIGRTSAVRAVAGAVARNPVSIVVPCHRVLGAGAALTGYAGGVARKAALLHLEGASFAPDRAAGLTFTPTQNLF